MEILLEIIKILIPTLVVFFTAYYSIKLLTKSQNEKKLLQIKAQSQKETLMLRLQAYERLVLLLERISPQNLVMRYTGSNLSPADFHKQCLIEIRAEFNHNVSQQLYISKNGWKIVKDAKEEIVKEINLAKENLPKNAKLMDFIKIIVDYDIQNNTPATIAIEYLRHEAHSLF